MTYCPNISCPSRILESIVHFASRSAMDIRGLGYERVRALLDAKLIANVADLYKVTAMQLLTLEGFAEKSAQQLVASIAASKGQPLSALLFGLGIRHVGQQGAKLLARHFGTMEALATASAEEVGEVRGIGPAIGEAVVGFFKDARNKDLLKSLAKSGLTLRETSTATGPRPLADQTFVVTGTLPTLSRQQARDLIEGAGGHVSDGLSKKTTALVVGADPGSKLEKAKSLGVEQIDEAELLRRANRKP
jgi:DNA ligase (NAD+)